jgi:hypothetical protein
VFTKRNRDTDIVQMSKETYQELLWHVLFRGTDTFFMWSSEDQFPEETRLVHEVYAASQQYNEFIEKGYPVTFDIPDKPGTVISGLALNNQVLIRRTDFCTDHSPVEILVGTKVLTIGYAPGVCKIYNL